jgi:hypothetical protein
MRVWRKARRVSSIVVWKEKVLKGRGMCEGEGRTVGVMLSLLKADDC